jgi:hypothetical protein
MHQLVTPDLCRDGLGGAPDRLELLVVNALE